MEFNSRCSQHSSIPDMPLHCVNKTEDSDSSFIWLEKAISQFAIQRLPGGLNRFLPADSEHEIAVELTHDASDPTTYRQRLQSYIAASTVMLPSMKIEPPIGPSQFKVIWGSSIDDLGEWCIGLWWCRAPARAWLYEVRRVVLSDRQGQHAQFEVYSSIFTTQLQDDERG